MGGYGSGRRSHKPKVEECNSLDVNQLCKEGCLRNGWTGRTIWSRNGAKISSIGMHTSGERLHLSYRLRGARHDWEDVDQSVLIERVPCRFGGWRPYFSFRCSKRVVKLYSAGRLFLCRHCYGLFHFSKNEGFWDRSLRQRTKHQRRLSGDASLDAYEMPKPKGMWWRTFYRLQRAAQAAENRAADDFIIAARWLLKMG
jgi:hypothetical protein